MDYGIAFLLSFLLTFFNEIEATKTKWFLPLTFTIFVLAILFLMKKDQGLILLFAAVFLFSVKVSPFVFHG